MPSSIQLFTIGFTQKSAEQFFESLAKSGIKTLIDTSWTLDKIEAKKDRD
jgi:hypothetical protein